jgi:hypothetical protein
MQCGTASAGEQDTLVAVLWSGEEVVFKLDPAKVTQDGLTANELDTFRRSRFEKGNYIKEINGKKMDLATVTTSITIRDLQAPPFVLTLPDGRRLSVKPKPKEIEKYLVTGEYFESDVRGQLSDPFDQDPLKQPVLQGIPVPGGHVPNAWGADHVHISIGEPLEKFAELKLTGEPGPQLPELERMRKGRAQLERALKLAQGMERGKFEEAFGKGTENRREPDPHFETIPSWSYDFEAGRLQSTFEEGKVDHVSTWTSLPLPSSGTNEEIASAAKKMADAERQIVIHFLKAIFPRLDQVAQQTVQTYLEQSAADMRWTDEERRTILGTKH